MSIVLQKIMSIFEINQIFYKIHSNSIIILPNTITKHSALIWRHLLGIQDQNIKISRYCKICSTTLMDGCCCCTRRLQPPRPIRKRKADDVNYVLWPRFSKKIDLNPLYSFFFLFVFSLSSSLCLQLCCVLILAKNAAFRSRKWKNIGKGRLSSSSFFFCCMSQKVIFVVETTQFGSTKPMTSSISIVFVSLEVE